MRFRVFAGPLMRFGGSANEVRGARQLVAANGANEVVFRCSRMSHVSANLAGCLGGPSSQRWSADEVQRGSNLIRPANEVWRVR